MVCNFFFEPIELIPNITKSKLYLIQWNLFEWIGNKKCVEILLQNGAIVNSNDADDETPLETAITKGFDQNSMP